jgi:hypothetical protein
MVLQHHIFKKTMPLYLSSFNNNILKYKIPIKDVGIYV